MVQKDPAGVAFRYKVLKVGRSFLSKINAPGRKKDDRFEERADGDLL
jgi:hypothetical protein